MNRMINLALVALLGVAATGCSVLSKSSNAKRGDSGQEATKTVKAGDATTEPGRRTEWLTTLDGEWSIVRAGKNDVHEDPENMPYLYFETSTGRFYASNGCNILNGSFGPAGENVVKFTNVLATANDCPDAAYRQAINSVLADGAMVSLKHYSHGQESYLDLISTGGSKLMTLRRHNLESINGKWIVTKIGNITVDDPEANLFFDVTEHKVHGNTGCNYFNGSILIDPEVDSSVTFEDMGVTMRMCENQETEMAMLVALEQAHTYRKNGNVLTLYSSSGKELMQLRR